MPIHSAGILCYRYREQELEVLLVHPGGPFWVSRDAGAWSIPKGIVEYNEPLLVAAQREFKEETGISASGSFIDLGECRQPSRKIVHAWAVEMDLDTSKLNSNTFPLEWPKGSGMIQDYPEVDEGAWFSLLEAREKIQPGQIPFLDRLVTYLA